VETLIVILRGMSDLQFYSMCKKWIRAMVFKIADLIPDFFKRKAPVEPEPASHVLTPLEKKLAREIQKREDKAREAGRAVDTRHDGPNMPKYQPCPQGHGWKRRKQKTMSGAYYSCPICGDFFVRVPRL
jgi:hypothetical protein